jgi:H+/gluconate symporter-like permease
MKRILIVLAVLFSVCLISSALYSASFAASEPAGSKVAEENATEETDKKKKENKKDAKENKDQKKLSVSDETLNVILVFLVLSVVFEVALAPIFDSSLFMARFEDKGIKTVITVVLALIFFWGYKLDIIQSLMVSMNVRKSSDPTFGGRIITALLIAGGSGGFHKILTNFGVRMKPAERQEKANTVKKAMEARQTQKNKPQQNV